MDFDNDDDDDSNVKKFKLNIRKGISYETAQKKNVSTNPPLPIIIKKKIFNSKQNLQVTTKNDNKLSSCKLNFNIDDDVNEDRTNEEIARLEKTSSLELSKKFVHPILTKPQSTRQPTKSASTGRMETSAELDLLDDMDFDNDDDDDSNAKKFKLNIRKEISYETTQKKNVSTNPPLPMLIKKKIFNSKQNLQETTKNDNKLRSYKLNFNVDDEQDVEIDDDVNEDRTNEEITRLEKTSSLELSKKFVHPILTKPQSTRQPTKSASTGGMETSALEVNLRNTRKAYECEELGEAQAFLDDLSYLIEGLSDDYKLSERCLSLLKLAEQCSSSEFRLNLRSSLSNDGYYLNKLFNLLSDSTKYKVISLR